MWDITLKVLVFNLTNSFNFSIWAKFFGFWCLNFEKRGKFINCQIFDDISNKLLQIINSKVFAKYKLKKVNNLAQIEKLNEFVRLKTKSLSVISKIKWKKFFYLP